MLINLPRMIFRPSCLVFFAACTLGLLCGIWPEAIYVWPGGGSDLSIGSLPTLHFIAVCQVLFFTLIYPLIVMCRDEDSALPYVIDFCVMSLMTLPVYYIASVFSDATLFDCVRVWLLILAIFPVGHGVGFVLRNNKYRSVALAGVLLFSLGLPLIYYVLIEFCPDLKSSSVVADFSPVLFTWSAAGAAPDVFWPPIAWAAIGISLLLLSKK